MKRIKFNQNKKTEDIAEVCKLASGYFYVFTSKFDTTGEMEIQNDDSNVDEACESIREEMTTENQFKASDNKTIRKILKDNYILVELYGKVGYLKSADDHRWDNAVFNGAM